MTNPCSPGKGAGGHGSLHGGHTVAGDRVQRPPQVMVGIVVVLVEMGVVVGMAAVEIMVVVWNVAVEMFGLEGIRCGGKMKTIMKKYMNTFTHQNVKNTSKSMVAVVMKMTLSMTTTSPGPGATGPR